MKFIAQIVSDFVLSLQKQNFATKLLIIVNLVVAYVAYYAVDFADEERKRYRDIAAQERRRCDSVQAVYEYKKDSLFFVILQLEKEKSSIQLKKSKKK